MSNRTRVMTDVDSGQLLPLSHEDGPAPPSSPDPAWPSPGPAPPIDPDDYEPV